MKRILMLSLVLALLAATMISTAAFAQGPIGGSDGSQARQGALTQNGASYGPGDGTGPIGGSDGSQARQGALTQNGASYGPGDGTGPIGGGQFGPGPQGTCADVNTNGVCDCQES